MIVLVALRFLYGYTLLFTLIDLCAAIIGVVAVHLHETRDPIPWTPFIALLLFQSLLLTLKLFVSEETKGPTVDRSLQEARPGKILALPLRVNISQLQMRRFR